MQKMTDKQSPVNFQQQTLPVNLQQQTSPVNFQQPPPTEASQQNTSIKEIPPSGEENISISSPYIPTNFFDALAATGDDFDFEKVLNTLKGLKDQASKLPDNERRALAASVALSFAKLLGEDE